MVSSSLVGNDLKNLMNPPSSSTCKMSDLYSVAIKGGTPSILDGMTLLNLGFGSLKDSGVL